MNRCLYFFHVTLTAANLFLFFVCRQIDVENSSLFCKVVLNLLEPQVFRFRNCEVNDRNGEEEDAGEEVEGSVEGEARLEDREELEGDDQKDAREAAGQAFAEGADFRRKKLTWKCDESLFLKYFFLVCPIRLPLFLLFSCIVLCNSGIAYIHPVYGAGFEPTTSCSWVVCLTTRPWLSPLWVIVYIYKTYTN